MCGIAGWISYDRDLTAHQDIIAAMMKDATPRSGCRRRLDREQFGFKTSFRVAQPTSPRAAEIEDGRRIPLDLMGALRSIGLLGWYTKQRGAIVSARPLKRARDFELRLGHHLSAL
jgi:hypothetical protein